MNESFDRFWEAWPAGPRKVDKKGCKKKWQDGKLDAKVEAIIANVGWHKSNNPQWKGGFIPMPRTYLNQARWDDGYFSLETKKPQGATTGRPDDKYPEPDVSRYGSFANLALLQSLLKRGGLRDDAKLARVVAAKNEVVALAESQRWENDDFKSVILETLRQHLGECSTNNQVAAEAA